MVSVVDAATALVVTAKVALLVPAGIVTLSGTEATAGLLLDKEMRAPPLGAGPLSVAVPVEGVGPMTLVGLSATEERVVARVEPSTQNSKKLSDHPLPSPTFVVTIRKNLACAASGSVPLMTVALLVRVMMVCQVLPLSEIWIE